MGHRLDIWVNPKPVGRFAWKVSDLLDVVEEAGDLPEPIKKALESRILSYSVDKGLIEVRTHGGWIACHPNGYIIEALDGELYPCPKHTFDGSYVTLDIPEGITYACNRSS